MRTTNAAHEMVEFVYVPGDKGDLHIILPGSTTCDSCQGIVEDRQLVY